MAGICLFIYLFLLGKDLNPEIHTHNEVDLALHPVVGLVLQVGNTEKFLTHLASKAWIVFSESASRVHVSQP